MKDEDKTKVEPIKDLKTLRKKREKSAVNNITERKQAEEKVNWLASFPILNTTPVLEIDRKKGLTFTNASAKKLFPDLEAKQMDHPIVARAMKYFTELNAPTVTHDDEEIEVNGHWYLQEIFLVSLNQLRIYAFDITERKQAEERIKHLNLVLRAIRDINQLIVKEKDRERLLKGACNSLIKTRGYYHSQIVLLDKEGKIDTYTEAGLGKDFLPLAKLLKKGELTPCGQIAIKQKDVVIIEDPASTCPDCPLVQACSDQGSVMVVRLEHNGKIYGVMSISIPTHFIIDKEEQALLKEVAGDIVLGLSNIEMKKKLDKQTHDLKERVKEFGCLFKLSQLIEKPGISPEGIFQELVSFLPSAWRYPEITCARIIFGDKEYKTENFKETIWKQSRDIKVREKTIGTIEVYYLEKRPEMDKGPFQKEEGDLLTLITERLGEFINRKNSTSQLEQSYLKAKKAMNATIETMSKIVEAKDPYTSGHQQRVSQLATTIAKAKELCLSQDRIEGIRIASLIHDIGKIGIPTEILSKPTTLTDLEFSLIKEHSQIGYDILQSIDFSYPVANIVLQHHERLNGSGYPKKIKGGDILLEAKIICVADVVEAMSSHRPYRAALGVDKALEEISQNRGILYEPKVVDVCLKLFKEKGFKLE